jgi:hypothetical protein
MPSSKVIPFTPRAQDRHKPSYKWLNAEWGDKQLPWIRLAVVVLGKDDTEIEAALKKLSFANDEDGSLAVILERWRQIKRDVDQMSNALDWALNRSLQAVERIKYDPDGAA